MYTLTATNKQGASITYRGATIKSVKQKFRAEYSPQGFKVQIRDENGVEHK
jgi:hypothetical protein